MKKRVFFYIDGFNLYYGIKKTKKQYLKWLDIEKLAAKLIRGGANLVAIKYFTARIEGNKPTTQRQKTYLNALSISEKITITYGHFLAKERTCRKCHSCYNTHEEKKTDVNIACELLSDAYENRFDLAYVVSGDSDLVPPIKKTVSMGKRIVIASPPNRNSKELVSVASASVHLNVNLLKKCVFSDVVVTKKGKKLSIPNEWKKGGIHP